jgi:hypothetical protein
LEKGSSAFVFYCKAKIGEIDGGYSRDFGQNSIGFHHCEVVAKVFIELWWMERSLRYTLVSFLLSCYNKLRPHLEKIDNNAGERDIRT